MHAIVPVAGKGTRLRPHTYSVPKPLLPVAGKPVLGHILDTLVEAGISRVTLIVGYMGDEIVSWARQNYDLEVDFAVQEVMNGLGSAIGLAEPLVDDGPVLIALGDTVFDADIAKIGASSRNMIGIRKVDDPRRFGVVVEQNGRVTNLVEKPAEFVSDLAIVGLYFFRSSGRLMEAIGKLVSMGKTTKGEYQLTDAMQLMLDEGDDFGTFRIDGWFDCGKTETLLETNSRLLDRSGSTVSGRVTDSVVIDPVHVAEGAQVSCSVIGPGVTICSGVTMDDCIVRQSIIGSDTTVESSIMESSILGRDAEVKNQTGSLNVGDCCKVLSN